MWHNGVKLLIYPCPNFNAGLGKQLHYIKKIVGVIMSQIPIKPN